MGTEIETVVLNLEGNLAAEARAQALGAQAFAAAVDKLGEAGVKAAGGLERLKAATAAAVAKSIAAEATAATKALEKEAAAAAKAATALDKVAKAAKAAAAAKDSSWLKEATARANILPTALQSSPEKLGGFARLVQGVGKIFGGDAAGALVKGGAFLQENAGAISAAGSVVKYGAIGLGVGAAAVAAAAAAIVYGAGKLLDAGVRFGVQETAAREKQLAILDKQTNGQGALTLKLALSLAGEHGVDPETAVERVKGLLQAKFSQETIKLLFAASADLGEVKGAEKAKMLLEQLQKSSAKGVNLESLNALAEAGVRATDVLEKLRKKGESLDQVKARLKAGKVAAEEFAKAVAAAIESDVGGVAGKGLDARVNQLKIQFSGLFSGFKLGPLENALKMLSTVLDSKSGEKLKGALSELGSTAIKALFGPFEGEKGKERLTKIMEGLTHGLQAVTAFVAALAPHIERVVDGFSRLFGDRDPNESGALKLFHLIADVVTSLASLDPNAAADAVLEIINMGADAVFEGISGLMSSIADGANSFADRFIAAGNSMADGLANGIRNGASKAVQAAINMASSALDAVESALGINSPSTKFAYLGQMSDAGYAKGANDNGQAAEAGADMASSALGGARGASGGRGGGGHTFNFAPAIALPAGSPEETRAAVNQALAAAYPEFLAMVRRALRDGREAA